MMTLETRMEWLSNGRNELQHARHETESSLNLLVRTKLNHLLILSIINFSDFCYSPEVLQQFVLITWLEQSQFTDFVLDHLTTLWSGGEVASFPGPSKNRRKGPGIHCSRMRLISM